MKKKIHKKWQTSEKESHKLVRKKMTKCIKLVQKSHKLVKKSVKKSQTSEKKTEKCMFKWQEKQKVTN